MSEIKFPENIWLAEGFTNKNRPDDDWFSSLAECDHFQKDQRQEYTRSDLVQKQIEEAVKKERARCARIIIVNQIPYQSALQARLDAANERLRAVKKLIKGWRQIERLFEFGWEGYGSAADELEQALKGHDDREEAEK